MLAGCSLETSHNEQEIIQTLKSHSAQFSKNLEEQNTTGIIVSYTENGVVMASDPDFIEGTEALAIYWEPYADRTILNHTIYPVDITVNGDYAYDYGYYRIQGKREATKLPVYNVKYIIVWEKVGGN